LEGVILYVRMWLLKSLLYFILIIIKFSSNYNFKSYITFEKYNKKHKSYI
jgi:hypothetical protein